MKRIRWAALLCALAMVLALAGCSKGPKPSASPTATPTPVPRPEVTAAQAKAGAPKAAGYAGYSMKIKPAQGQPIVLKDDSAVQLVMEAAATQRLQVQDAKGEFKSKLTVLDRDGKERYAFAVASDGQMLLKKSDGAVFRMPEYVYYLLENTLWTYDASLLSSDIKWQPDKGTSTLELELPRLIKTAMLPAFGYSLAYFTSYTVYGVNTGTRNVAKVYLLADYSGYDIHGTSFSPVFFYTTPMTLIFTTTGNNLWKLTALKQPVLTALATPTPELTPQATASGDVFGPSPTPSPTTEATPKPTPNLSGQRVPLKGQALYDGIRTIFPFDYMESVVDDMNNKKNTDGVATLDTMKKDILRQATEYLNDTGIQGLTVED